MSQKAWLIRDAPMHQKGKTDMAFIETPAHTAIFNAIKERKENIIIEAVAGAGKTTTIVKALECVPSTESVAFLAFNASIAMELKSRVPSHCEALTLNSLGFRAWNNFCTAKYNTRSSVDDYKSSGIIEKIKEENLFSGNVDVFGPAAKRLVACAKSSKTKALTEYQAMSLIDQYDIEIPDLQDQSKAERLTIELAQLILSLSNKNHLVVDFADQLYLPVIFNVACKKYDRIFVDESQDLSPLQHELIQMSLKRDGQLVAVGDPRQAIYAWRGADSNSMVTLAERFKANSLPLHVSYRCARSIVARAQKVVAHIQPHADAPEGVVDNTVHNASEALVLAGDLVVSRTTAPAVSFAYSLLRRGRPVCVLGRDIGAGLTALVKKLNAKTVDSLVEKTMAWAGKEIEKALAKKAENKIVAINDKKETLLCLCEDAKSVNDVLRSIEELFSTSDAIKKITIATIHKAKGLEADRVWILNPQLLPHPMAKQQWQREQEMNLLYVAITRAKRELRFISNMKTINKNSAKGFGIETLIKHHSDADNKEIADALGMTTTITNEIVKR